MVIKTRPPRRRTPSPTWQRRPADRPAELLDAAAALFAQRGVMNTTVADITAAAGVAKGSFYRYFESRDALLAELKARFFAGMIDTAAAAVADAGALARDALLELGISTAIGYLWRNAALIRVWNQVEDPESSYQQTTSGLKGFAGMLAMVISDGVTAGEFDCPDPPSTARLLVYAIQGATTSAILDPDTPTPDALIAAALELTRRALGAGRQPAQS